MPDIMLPMDKISGQEAIPSLESFASRVHPFTEFTQFHITYYKILELFARGVIRKLIVSVPPQHGKSLGCSVLLPAYALGLDPDRKIALASYNVSLASKFNRRVQRIIDDPQYRAIFPGTQIRPLRTRSEFVRTASHVEIIGHRGELYSAGRGGSLTGYEVDMFILDDLYKNATEANSPVVRESCLEWYTSVVRTRLHNGSSEMMVFTRWHEEDLIGTIMSNEDHIVFNDWIQLHELTPSTWLVVNFESIREGSPTVIDPRNEGEPLWPAKHSLELLENKRKLDPYRFQCMYQGKPSAAGGLLYGTAFRLYTGYPVSGAVVRGNYTDTADMGDDYLCSICYDVVPDGLIYVTDVVYSREPMEVTEVMVARMLERNGTRTALFESNNGGRGFARAVGRLVPHVRIQWFHQSGNKQSRIAVNASTVLQNVLFPEDWSRRWKEMYNHLVTYKRKYEANRWHDAPDVLTGIVEREIMDAVSKRIKIRG